MTLTFYFDKKCERLMDTEHKKLNNDMKQFWYLNDKITIPRKGDNLYLTEEMEDEITFEVSGNIPEESLNYLNDILRNNNSTFKVKSITHFYSSDPFAMMELTTLKSK